MITLRFIEPASVWNQEREIGLAGEWELYSGPSRISPGDIVSFTAPDGFLAGRPKHVYWSLLKDIKILEKKKGEPGATDNPDGAQ